MSVALNGNRPGSGGGVAGIVRAIAQDVVGVSSDREVGYRPVSLSLDGEQSCHTPSVLLSVAQT